MPSYAGRWGDRLARAAREAMEEIGDTGEQVTRDARGWNDDTHSAEESITGFEVREGDPGKNFHAVNWQMAQKRGSLKYGTPGSNFVPVGGNTVSFPDEDEVAVVTGWVRYLEILESHPAKGSYTFERALGDMETVGENILVSAMRKV